jgi:nitrous oxidase accessory protein NosD
MFQPKGCGTETHAERFTTRHKGNVEGAKMKSRTAFISFALLALFLILAPAARASNTWYVDGVNGSDGNDCKSAQTACKTIGHAIELASSGDTINVAPATYTENLLISKNLKITGSDAATTIVDGNQAGTVFNIYNRQAHVTLSKLTIRNGFGEVEKGGGINNVGTLAVIQSTITANSNSDANGDGGGIFNSGTLTVKKSTITANFGGLTGGGILWRWGTSTGTASPTS